jgi:hypothetical protein
MSDIRTASDVRPSATSGDGRHLVGTHDAQSWNHERDEVFFLITQRLFAPAFLSGASALLSTYDDV